MDACVAQLVRAVDRQSNDPGSNPDTVERVSFSTDEFLIILKLYNNNKVNQQVVSIPYHGNFSKNMKRLFENIYFKRVFRINSKLDRNDRLGRKICTF